MVLDKKHLLINQKSTDAKERTVAYTYRLKCALSPTPNA